MNKLCEQKEIVIIIKYFLITIKYIIPIVITIIGMLKLICIKNKKKALKKFLMYLLIAIIIFLITLFTQIMLLNTNKCIQCTMKNNCEINNNTSETKQSEENIGNQSINQLEEVISSTNSSATESQIETINGVTYIDGILIVNKTYSIPKHYAPENANGYNLCNSCLTKETMRAFEYMQIDATALGLNIYISSGYRSYDYQNGLYNNYVSIDGKEAADKYSARPGHSEHQTGLAFDLNTIDDSFANTAEGKWISENCWRYGLILRYPQGKEDKTGYQYESWHLRYVGNELAETLYNNGNWITLEEYFNLKSVYNNV